MGLFVSSQDYIFGANECVKKNVILCGRSYTFWCKKDSQEKIDEILVKIQPIIENIIQNNKEANFEKVLLMTLFDIAEDVNKNITKCNAIKNDCDDKKNSNNFELQEQSFVDDFIIILEAILNRIK